VKHANFGEGKVSAVSSSQGDQTLTVDFGEHGSKKLLASKAPIEPVGTTGGK
jgi:hypothetical protein